MFKFKDTSLPYNCRLRDSLTAVYGVGYQKSSYICDSLGLGSTFNINYLNNYFYEAIIASFKNFYILDDRLKSILSQRFGHFFEIRLIKGLRMSKGLPVRGQRTQTNSQNARNLKPIFPKNIQFIINAQNASKNVSNKGKMKQKNFK
jgi:small subunit ribosomal protein S13